jgi:Putative Ig domain
VSINANGVISGKPITTLGTFSFTVRATDRFGYTGDAVLSITVT